MERMNQCAKNDDCTAEKERVEELKRVFRKQLENARDQILKTLVSDSEQTIAHLSKEITEKKTELSNLSAFSFGTKKELKNEIEELQFKLMNEQKRRNGLKEKEEKMEDLIRMQCEDFSSKDTYTKELEQYLIGFKRELERNDNEENKILAELKDRMDQILAEEDHPIMKKGMIDQLCTEYPEYRDFPDLLFATAVQELFEEGRIEASSETEEDCCIASKKRFHSLPPQPDAEEMIMSVFRTA